MGLRAVTRPGQLLRRHPTAPAALFIYAAAFLAYGGVPPASRLAWITVAAATARTAAWAINRIVDVDAGRLHRIRTAALGAPPAHVSQGPAFLLAVAAALALIIAAGQLNQLSLWLSPLPVMAFVIHPYAARRPGAGRALCGLAHAMGPAGGWVAVRGAVEGPACLLGGAVGLWIAGLDLLHRVAGQDAEQTALSSAMRAHAGAALLWVAAGWATGRAWWYFAGLAAALVLVARRYARAASNPAGPRPLPVLDSAAPVSLILLAATLADVLVYP